MSPTTIMQCCWMLLKLFNQFPREHGNKFFYFIIFNLTMISYRTKVAEKYQELSNEYKLRDPCDIERHFNDSNKLCNHGKKITGDSGTFSLNARAQSIKNKLMNKINSGNYGSESVDSESEDGEDEEDDDEIEIFPISSTENSLNFSSQSSTVPTSTQISLNPEISLAESGEPKKRSLDQIKTKNTRDVKRHNIGNTIASAVKAMQEGNQVTSLMTLMQMQQENSNFQRQEMKKIEENHIKEIQQIVQANNEMIMKMQQENLKMMKEICDSLKK